MNTIAITRRATLTGVGTKSIDPRYVERVSAILRAIVDSDFKDKPDDEIGNQRRAAKSLHISQAQISALYNLKPGKGVGLPTLLALRAYTNRSIDDLLGLGPLPSERLAEDLRASFELYLSNRKPPLHAVAEPVVQHRPLLPANVTPIVPAPEGASKDSVHRRARGKSHANRQNREAAEKRAREDAAKRHAAKKRDNETG